MSNEEGFDVEVKCAICLTAKNGKASQSTQRGNKRKLKLRGGCKVGEIWSRAYFPVDFANFHSVKPSIKFKDEY